MAAGSSWRYRRVAGGEATLIEVAVTGQKRTVSGVEATVVRSVSFLNGELVENRHDWYAQDKIGNVWHLGTTARRYVDGVTAGTAGSWKAGANGARAAIILPAQPELGTAYRQEHGAGNAEGRARIVSFDQAVRVPGGAFSRTLVVEETTPVLPRQREHRLYARGVGPVLAIDLSARGGRVELVRFTRGSTGR